ncbi:Amino acid adenylation domain protein [Paraburkholderia kururiensis]|uniref:amino acid adenylation domain-containing protein n=1 Tax=Paraburkholderia kururiensis TaxID=984307 RepID=UPI0039A6101F
MNSIEALHDMSTTATNEPAVHGDAHAVAHTASGFQGGQDATSQALAISRKYAALAVQQRRRFRERVREQGIDPAHLPVVPLSRDSSEQDDGGHCYPLSASQQRLWFLWNVDPSSPAYNLSRAMRLTGALDVRALRRAFDALVARHGALRATFIERDGTALQRIPDAAGYAWRERVLDDPAALSKTLRDAAREPFDLRAGPMLRVDLIALDTDCHVLLVVTHHIVSDGWSQALLVRELAALYGAAIRSDGREESEGSDIARSLPQPGIHFGDVAAWQEEWRDGAPDDDLAYWIARLGVERPALELPLDRARPAVRSVDGGRCRVDVNAELARPLRDLARRHGTTLFTALLGAYAALLYRYGGQTCIRIGVPMAGRRRRETEALIGYFVNTLVIEADVSGAMPFDALLAGLHARVLEAQEHQDASFGRVLDSLHLERDLGRAPLFQVMFNLEQATSEASVAMPGLVVQAEESGTGTARFDLALNVVDDGHALRLMFNYAVDVFNRTTVERVAAHYETVLRQLAQDSARRVGELELLTRGSGEARLTRYPFMSLGTALVAQAQRTPSAVAVRCEDESLGYGELDAWSAAVARQLMERGAGAEHRVGLCVRRGPALIAALVGIIRSGAAFVPLDPEYPAARLTQMMQDAGITRVVADAVSAQRMAGVLAGCEVIDVGQHDEVPAGRFVSPLHPDQLAYVLYTSGSTGRPKGVAVSHGALWTHLQDFLATYGISAADTVLHSSTVNFDVALHETLPALLTGATVEMRGEQPWDLQGLGERLVSRGVTFARIPTALWQQWQRHAPPRGALRLRQVTVGGEALPGDALAHWREGPLGDIRLDNLYGPTETTVAALYRRTCAEDGNEVTVPIGRPYPGRTARVLDAFGDGAPVGGLGELCIGGPTVARGYLGRAALTAERFVPDPYGGPGARQYRSGDLCRMRADGTVEFLGRLDQQVKLRGQRIEPGEIEAVLRQCPGVREAAVVVTGEGEKRRLAAYVSGEAQPDTLQRALEQKLPGYMVPSSVTVLERLPWMPSGKLDRAALPPPQEVPRGRVEASNELEALLLSVWCAVLGRDDLGVTENFFEAGGDSIQSLQIIAKARQAGLKLTPRQVFEHPTVAALAQRVERLDVQATANVVEDDEPLALTPIQRLFFERYPQGESHWNQAVLLKVQGRLDVPALERAARALAQRHDALRLRFVKQEEGWKQVAVHEIGEDLVRSEPLASLGELEAACGRIQASLDIERGPVWRLGYFETPEGQTRLLVAIHHLSVDGVSWRVLLNELQTAYGQAERGEPVTLPAPSTSWRTWVRHLLRYARSAELMHELAWWQVALDAPALRGGRVFSERTPHAQPQKTLRTKLSADLTALLLREAPRAYRLRVDEVLLAALSRSICEVTSRDEVLVELEGHGREDVIEGVDLSRTVGWFTTQYPLALPGASVAPEDALLRVHERLGAVPRRGFGWGLLTRCADESATATLKALPVPEIAFNYLGRFEQTFRTGDRFGFASESSGAAMAARARTPDRALDVNAWIAGDSLSLSWGYAPQFVSEAVARQIMTSFETTLGELIEHLRAAPSSGRERVASPRPSPMSSPLSSLLSPWPPAPAALQARARHDDVAASWVARAVYESALPVPPAHALSDWLARRRKNGQTIERTRALDASSDASPPHDARLPAVPLNALGASTTLFALHPGYGMVGEYRTLAQALNGRVSVIALQAPALRGAPWRGETFEALAAHYAACIEALQPEGPCALLGWSFGGRLAVAIADVLARRGRHVPFIGIVDTATHREDGPDPLASDEQHAASFDETVVTRGERTLLGEAFAVDAMHAALMARHTLPRIDADLHVWRALRTADPRRRMDWAQWTAGQVHWRELDATHTSIVHHPALAGQLLEALQTATT